MSNTCWADNCFWESNGRKSCNVLRVDLHSHIEHLTNLTVSPHSWCRSLMAKENLDGRAMADEALRLPTGNSKQVSRVS